MQMNSRRLLVAALPLTLAAAWLAGSSFGAESQPGLSLLVQNDGTEYVTQSGTSSTFPGTLRTGDRIFSRDTLLAGGARVGYDNLVCTATFDGNDYCVVTLELEGKGSIQASWLWVGRNTSVFGPPRFAGVIDGGTEAYAHARGEFEARTLPMGELELTASLK